ncbi:hypothetical protein Pint_03444 [Pistacia integerrima]|uniref:Uncharacterized protein n=1 Tax=Pistacia integerrima TaxID=434235 RepID=A0ACC0ZG57_9ROSI|nr:hypothetical protein Pint_03444 [Pistacia integerrima]
MSTNQESNSKQTLIVSYGTLKRGFSNHYLMQELINKNVAVFLGSGNRVKGELYSVSTQGLARLDEFEGTKFGHYDRLPVQVQSEEDEGEGLVEAEAYFANKSFAERLWEKKGKVGWNEYRETDGKQYVMPGDRAKDSCILDDIELFLSSIQ